MFLLVETKENIKKISKMAKTIWKEHYQDIISDKQIDYMLNKYLSKDAIISDINQGYQYYLIKDDKPCGFISVRIRDDIFISKFYLLKSYRQKGYLRRFIDELKTHQKTIHLTVNKKNQIAIDAYSKLGFKITESVVKDIGSSFVMDDYVMIL